jgi:thiamine-monophosphate kinase
MDSETRLVERIARNLALRLGPKKGTAAASSPKGLLLGIGDDAAIIRPPAHGELVMSCDAFLEGIHFLPDVHSADSIGYKSLARATSDLAAMGATPLYFLLTLALPLSRTKMWLDEFIRGMRRALRVLRIQLVGGDTTQNRSIFISVTVVGQITRGKAVRRSGAKPGDTIYVSGKLGKAQLGLELVRRNLENRRSMTKLARPHLYPEIRLELGAWLANHQVASAMLDVSDGLSTDLHRLCAASGVGARLWEPAIPCVALPAHARREFDRPKFDALEMALNGGDDYELLFTVPPTHQKRLRAAPTFPALTAIGEITREKQVAIVDAKGSSRTLKARGWDSFAGKADSR